MKTLGELILTDFDAARPILEAWARGETLEYDWLVGWDTNKDQKLYREVTYRIPPRPHTVDWSQVGECIYAFQTFGDGRVWALTATDGQVSTAFWPSFRPGTMPWQDSRIERPKEGK